MGTWGNVGRYNRDGDLVLTCAINHSGKQRAGFKNPKSSMFILGSRRQLPTSFPLILTSNVRMDPGPAEAPWPLAPGLCPPQPAGRQSVRGRDGTSSGYQSWADTWAGGRTSRERGCTSGSPAGALLAARHDLKVLQGTASSLPTSCLPGGCRAMTHSSWLRGQLHQALAEPTQAQLLWRPRERKEAVLGGKAAPTGASTSPSCLPDSLYPSVLLCSSPPPSPGPATSHTNIQVADMEGLLLRELTEDSAAGRAQST